jgi:PST family polysaccharide transporter
VIAGALLYLVAPALIGVLLGPGYEPAVPVIRVLALLLPVMGISMPLVVQWMIPLGLDRDLMWIALAAGILHIPMAVLLALQFAHIGIAWAYVVTETCSLLAIVLTLYFRGLIPFTFQLPAEPELQFREDY